MSIAPSDRAATSGYGVTPDAPERATETATEPRPVAACPGPRFPACIRPVAWPRPPSPHETPGVVREVGASLLGCKSGNREPGQAQASQQNDQTSAVRTTSTSRSTARRHATKAGKRRGDGGAHERPERAQAGERRASRTTAQDAADARSAR